MKQTAVEWLEEKLIETGLPFKKGEAIEIEQAKEMEEQNTIEILVSYHNSLFNIPLKEGEAKKIVEHIKKEL
jgi:hypothetical protein